MRTLELKQAPLGGHHDRHLTGSVLVIEHHAMVAEVFVLALRAVGLHAEACTPETEADVLGLVATFSPDVVLLDVMLPGCTVTAPDLVASVRATGALVVALTGSNDELLVGGALAAGASDVVSKVAPVRELLDTVAAALRGESRLGATQRLALVERVRRDQAERAARLAPFATLTRREGAVLAHLMEGEPAERIAASCFVSLATVRSQIRAVLTKLGVSSQLAAVAMAYRAGWMPGPEPRG